MSAASVDIRSPNIICANCYMQRKITRRRGTEFVKDTLNTETRSQVEHLVMDADNKHYACMLCLAKHDSKRDKKIDLTLPNRLKLLLRRLPPSRYVLRTARAFRNAEKRHWFEVVCCSD